MGPRFTGLPAGLEWEWGWGGGGWEWGMGGGGQVLT